MRGRIGLPCLALVFLAGTARAEQWLQRYHDAQHSNFISGAVDPLANLNFEYTFDAASVGVGIHYTDPKIEANGDMLVPFRSVNGTIVTYSVQKLTGTSVVWTFDSDYVRQPSTAWEPLFDFALNNGIVSRWPLMAAPGSWTRRRAPI